MHFLVMIIELLCLNVSHFIIKKSNYICLSVKISVTELGNLPTGHTKVLGYFIKGYDKLNLCKNGHFLKILI